MKKHPLFWFYGLAFALAWLGWLPVIAGSRGVALFDHSAFQLLLLLPAVGPTLAALIVVQVTTGKAATRQWFRGIWRWRVGWSWLGVAVFLPLVFLMANKIITQLLHWPERAAPTDDLDPGFILAAFVIAILANPWEEVGWRGFALPRLQARYTALTATFIVGILWGLWHLPLFFWPDNPMSAYPFGLWFISIVAEAFVYTWLYNGTRGSVFIVALYHVMENALGPMVTGTSFAGACLVYVVGAITLIAINGPAHLARTERMQAPNG